MMRLWETPVPIPNTMVKPQAAEGTWWVTAWENRRLPAFLIAKRSQETSGGAPQRFLVFFVRAGLRVKVLSSAHYVYFVSSVFDYAVRMQLVKDNPCRNVTLPTQEDKERDVYTLEEVQKMLSLFEKESEANYKYTIFFTLAAFTGLRRGELLGLEWKDFDWETQLMKVVRTSEWTKEKGIYTDTPKTRSSKRVLKLPIDLCNKLKEFKLWQDGYKASIGSKWVESDRLFTKWNGEPMGMRSPYKYFEKLCKRTGMRFVNVHSFRHFNATAMILNGVDVKTVQTCLGHNDANTTLSIYAHSFQEAQARAMDSVANSIYGKISPEKNLSEPSDANCVKQRFQIVVTANKGQIKDKTEKA